MGISFLVLLLISKMGESASAPHEGNAHSATPLARHLVIPHISVSLYLFIMASCYGKGGLGERPVKVEGGLGEAPVKAGTLGWLLMGEERTVKRYL
jgi:hypothetical protein